MAEYTVSMVIPAYKCADTIQRSIDSLLAQTRRPDEIIVVDDGSPDDIGPLLAVYGDAVQLIRKSNGGAASARNAGIDASTGNMIAFLDADDIWEPDKLRQQLVVFDAHPEVGLVSSRYILVEPDDKVRPYPMAHQVSWNRVLHLAGAESFRLAMYIWTGVVIIRRETLGSDRFDTNLATAEDRDLWARLTLRTPVYITDSCLARWYERAESLSHCDIDLDCRCMLRMIRKHSHTLGMAGVRKWETHVYRRWAGDCLGHGNARSAVNPAVRRLVYQPLSVEGWWVLLKSALLALAGKPLRLQKVQQAVG